MILIEPPKEISVAQEKNHILVPVIDMFSYIEQRYEDSSAGYRINIGKISYVIMSKKKD